MSVDLTLYNTLLQKLKFISSIKSGDKICIKTQTLVSKKSFIGAFFRYWTDENRIGTLNELHHLSELSRNLSRFLSPPQLDQLHSHLSDSIIGIKHLLSTYIDDDDTYQQLQNIIDDYSKLLRLIKIRHEISTSPISSHPPVSSSSTISLSAPSNFYLHSSSSSDSSDSYESTNSNFL